MSSIADWKSDLQAKTPVVVFRVVLKDGSPYYWSPRAITWDGDDYDALVLSHSPLLIPGEGVYGVDAVDQISLELNNADANLNAILDPTIWQGGSIQPFWLLLDPATGATSDDQITYPKFLIDLPTETFPRVKFSAHSKWNLARKMLPLSVITKRDRYPFPDTEDERDAAFNDPTSEFYANGYSPENGHGNYKTGTTPYSRAEYNGMREDSGDGAHFGASTIGLSVRFGGFGKVPATTSFTPKKGERADFPGDANEAKYAAAVPLIYGTCRYQPVVLDTGSLQHWNGARLSHLLLCDGVNFSPENTALPGEGDCPYMGIEDVVAVYLRDVPGASSGSSDGRSRSYQVPETSNETTASGSWTFYGGYYGAQKGSAPTTRYRNIVIATDLPQIAAKPADFEDRDLYSGLAYLELGLPKELSGTGLGPKVEVIVKGLKVETWDAALTVTWQWSDNPVWIFIDLLKRLGWKVEDDIDMDAAYEAAKFCGVDGPDANDGLLSNGKKRFRCNLALTAQVRASDVLRGIRNSCRMYTTWGTDGKLQLKIKQDASGEGGTVFDLDDSNLMRAESGELLVQKFHRSVYEMANVFSCNFQDEDAAPPDQYNAASDEKVDIDHVNQIGERIPGDSIFPLLGVPSWDQAARQLFWAAQEQVTLNEYYRVRASLSMIEQQVGQIGTITVPRLGLDGQECRIVSMAPGAAGPGGDPTIDLVLKKHSDGAYTDDVGPTLYSRALNDSTYSPRSVGAAAGDTPHLNDGNPQVTELFIQGDLDPDKYVRQIRVGFTPPPRAYEGTFSRATKISNLTVFTTSGAIPGDQVLFIEVAPVKSGARGIASDYLLANIPAGTSTNHFTIEVIAPPEADQIAAFVGSHPGRLYYHSTVNVSFASFNVIELTGIDATGISPDPGFDHVIVWYRYGSTGPLKFAGRTDDPDATDFFFEPEVARPADTEITVYVQSVNAAETDFYPFLACPRTTITLTKDIGNPSGAANLVLLTTDDDPTIPTGHVVAEMDRDTTNYKNITDLAIVLSSALPGEGPYETERDGASGFILETGTCTIAAASTTVTVTRSADPNVVGRVFLIYTADASPDSDLDGEVIAAQGANSITLTRGFRKGGSYTYSIVRRWWDQVTDPPDENRLYRDWKLAELNLGFGGVESPRWRTYPFPVAPGRYWGAGYTRNPFGVGTRVVTGSDKIVVAGVGQKILLTDADTVEVDLALGTYFVIFFDSGRASRIMQFVNPPHDGYGFILESHQSGDGSQTYDLDTEQVINYTSEIPSSALPASPYAIRNHGFVYDLTGDYYSLDGISTPLTF